MTWQKMRQFVDILMSVILIFEMFYTLTGNFLHEVIGVLFFVTLIIHTVLSRNWIKGIAIKKHRHQKLSINQKARIAAIIFLIIALSMLLISSLLISNILSSATGLMITSSLYDILVLIHTACAYATCIATIGHVSLHWVSLFKSLKIPYNPQRRKAISTGVTTLASIGIVAVGITAIKETTTWDELVQSAKAQTEPQSKMQEKNTEEPSANKRFERKMNDSDVTEKENSTDNTPSSESRSQESERTQSESGSSSSICTLCKKRCSLSAPKCNKPYAAGLI